MSAVPRLLRHRDPVLAAALAAFGVAEVLARGTYEGRPTYPGPVPLAVLGVALMTVPLAWRRSHPLASCTVVLATVVAVSLTLGATEGAAGFLATLVACFSGTAYARSAWVVPLVATAATVVHNVVDPTVRGPADWFWSFGFVVVAVLLGAAVRSRQIRIMSLEEDAAVLAREYDERVAAATAAERAAIARELHDIVAHAVSVIVVQAQAGARALDDAPQATARALDTIETTGRSALEELRLLLRLLRDETEPGPADPSPGLARLEELSERFRSAGLGVRLALPTPLPPLSAAADLAAYRLVQEALTNTVRHAPGATAEVVVTTAGSEVEVVVRDDGPAGARPSDAGSGRGLIGMRERVGLAGGRLVECGATDVGFRVRALLPLVAEQAAPVSTR